MSMSVERLAWAGDVGPGIEELLERAAAQETPEAAICLQLARAFDRAGRPDVASQWAMAVVDAGDDFSSWRAAAGLARPLVPASGPPLRSARVAILGSYTTNEQATLLWLAAARIGIDIDVYECPYGQYRQEILDPASPMYSFDPDFVLLAVHDGELALPAHSERPSEDVATEAARWTSLWRIVGRHCRARVVQHTFVASDAHATSHLSARMPGSRHCMIRALNLRLGEAAGASVSLVDCERLSALVGTHRWFEPRYWHLAKAAVGYSALPLLARHTAAVLAGELGLARKCIVVDLDDTLWGGIVGEVGLAGLQLGDGVTGEAFVSFQEYLLELKEQGVLLAVCSKNNEADAREPFERHPEMRIRLGDLATFVATWEPKPDQVRLIADSLGLGLESLVFVDDSPAEREQMRRFAPQVDVVRLPPDPSGYVRCLSDYLLFEKSYVTADDRRRTDQYRARAEIVALADELPDLDDFHSSLRMRAVLAPFDQLSLPRVVQLINKTNQFNLTTRRHAQADVERFVDDPCCTHVTLRLRDRFADHGLVAVLIAFGADDVLDIDTFLMSCRVLGRTLEATALSWLCRRAGSLGYRWLQGTYVPTPRNEVVKGVFGQFGFTQVGDENGTTTWRYDLDSAPPIHNRLIVVEGDGPQ